ncbi:hypothetical protein GQ457_14G016640 [Hibiscus cannabinus]
MNLERHQISHKLEDYALRQANPYKVPKKWTTLNEMAASPRTMEEIRVMNYDMNGPVSSCPSSVDRVKTSILLTSRMEECRVIFAKEGQFPHLFRIAGPTPSWPSSVDRDRCHLGLRMLIGSRHQSSRPQGWKSIELSSQKQDNFLTFFRIAGPVSSWHSSVDWERCHLGLRQLIGSRHQSSRPQGWKSAELSSQKLDNFLTFSELQDWCHLGLRPVSSWPSSVDRMKTSIFPTSRMKEY